MIVPARTGVRRRCTCLLFYCCYRRAEEAVVDTVVENVSNSPNLFCGPHFQTSRSLFTREKYLVVRTDDGHTENNKENNKAFYSVAGYIQYIHHVLRVKDKRQDKKRGYHTMVVEQIGILTRRSRVTREARALTTNRMLTISLNST